MDKALPGALDDSHGSDARRDRGGARALGACCKGHVLISTSTYSRKPSVTAPMNLCALCSALSRRFVRALLPSAIGALTLLLAEEQALAFERQWHAGANLGYTALLTAGGE